MQFKKIPGRITKRLPLNSALSMISKGKHKRFDIEA